MRIERISPTCFQLHGQVIIIGGKGVGKTSLIQAFSRGFSNPLHPYSNDISVYYRFGNAVIKLLFIDTPNGENTLWQARDGSVVLFCYDSSNSDSLVDILNWTQKLVEIVNRKDAVFIVGLKSDIEIPGGHQAVVDHAQTNEFQYARVNILNEYSVDRLLYRAIMKSITLELSCIPKDSIVKKRFDGKIDWKNSGRASCKLCSIPFSAFKSQIVHCRLCAEEVCDSCSRFTLLLYVQYSKKYKKRSICNSCVTTIQPIIMLRDSRIDLLNFSIQLKNISSLLSSSSSTSSSHHEGYHHAVYYVFQNENLCKCLMLYL